MTNVHKLKDWFFMANKKEPDYSAASVESMLRSLISEYSSCMAHGYNVDSCVNKLDMWLNQYSAKSFSWGGYTVNRVGEGIVVSLDVLTI